MEQPPRRMPTSAYLDLRTEVNMEAKKGEHPFSDVGQLILLVAFLVLWGVDSFLLRRSTFLSSYVPLYIRLVLFGLALIAAIYLVKSGHVVTSHGERPAGLVQTGAFRYVRHPMYLASILFYLGLAVSTLSLLALVLFVGIFVFHDYIASYEEKLLEARLGDEYREYKRKTGKWVPRSVRTR
jgi:protein-S-isoprenylcysteine O-methyltransferase Ste14